MAQSLMHGLARRGYRRAVPRATPPLRRGGVPFDTPSAPDWPEHLLSAVPRQGGGAATLAWCFDTSRIDALPIASPPSAQRVVGAVHTEGRSRAWRLDEVLGALEECGVDRGSLAAGILPGPPDEGGTEPLAGALSEVGIRERAVVDRLPPGMPRRLGARSGPCFTLESPVGPGCSAHCRPGCSCGRYVLLGYGRFGAGRSGAGRSGDEESGRGRSAARPGRAVFEAVLLEPAVGCVLAGVRSSLELPALRPLVDGIDGAFPELSAGPRGRAAVEVVADHLCTVALLLGGGIAPGPRGASHVVRRLVRRAATEVLLAGGRPEGLVTAAALADAAVRAPLGLAPLPADALALVHREVVALRAGLATGRRWFLRRASDTRPDDLPQLVWRARRERGVPIAILLAWCEERSLPVPLSRLAALDPPHPPHPPHPPGTSHGVRLSLATGTNGMSSG
ncbi:alanine--tRNA ligase-related protein [Kitasatospora sp. NPDC028055]|uniref:alanine--tRNA ligase-related protein n=1 Tax=Kitasatospora sp. NPDC028055 TaxID=3155653 RepID=UPI0033CCA2B7